jgi:alkyl hydroperoxide reductase subunit AhpF
MEEADLKKLESGLGALTGKVEIAFQPKVGDAFSEDLEGFCRDLAGRSEGQVRVAIGDGGYPLPGLPAFTLKADGRRNIHYLALPEQNEIAPFVNALRYTAEGTATVPAGAEENLSRISKPVEIQVFVSPFCTNCPKVVETAIRFASKYSFVSVIIVDVQRFAELAEPYGIKSVPATVIDKELVLIAQVSPEHLSKLLAERGTEFYDRELIRSFMERSRPAEAAALICEGRGRKGILELFQEPEISTRMGVLVVLEQALGQDEEAFRDMVPPLIQLLSHEDSRIRGDIADFLGTVGDRRAIPAIEKLLKDSDPDVVEAAEDALEELR